MTHENDSSYDEFDPDEKSKTQIKQEMYNLLDLGVSLISMKKADLSTLPITPVLRAAIDETVRIKHKNALKRHHQFIGKLMRDIDIEALNTALEYLKEKGHRSAKNRPFVQKWAEDFINDEKSALDAFLSSYPTANIQKLRQMIRQAKKEVKEDKDKEIKRKSQQQKLFKVIQQEITLAENYKASQDT